MHLGENKNWECCPVKELHREFHQEISSKYTEAATRGVL